MKWPLVTDRQLRTQCSQRGAECPPGTPCSLGTQLFPSCILTPHSGHVESTHTHCSLHFFFLGSLAASRPRVDCQCGTHCDKTVLLPFRNDI